MKTIYHEKNIALIMAIFLSIGLISCGEKKPRQSKRMPSPPKLSISQILKNNNNEDEVNNMGALVNTYEQRLKSIKNLRIVELQYQKNEIKIQQVENLTALTIYFVNNHERLELNENHVGAGETTVLAQTQTVKWAINNISALNNYSRDLQKEFQNSARILTNARTLMDMSENKMQQEHKKLREKNLAHQIPRAQLAAYYSSSPALKNELKNYRAYSIDDFLEKAKESYHKELSVMQITDGVNPLEKLDNKYIEWETEYYLTDWQMFVDTGANSAIKVLHDTIAQKQLSNMVNYVEFARDDLITILKHRKSVIRDNIANEFVQFYNLLHDTINSIIEVEYKNINNELARLRQKLNFTSGNIPNIAAYKKILKDLENRNSKVKEMEKHYRGIIVEVQINPIEEDGHGYYQANF